MSATLLRSAAGRLSHAGRCCVLEAQHPALARDRSASASTSGRQELHSGRRTRGARRQRAALHAEAPAEAPLAEEVGDEWWEEARADVQPQAEVLTEVQLPPATATRVKTAEYKSSAVRLDQCPPAMLPEFAVIGRSNVGLFGMAVLLLSFGSLHVSGADTLGADRQVVAHQHADKQQEPRQGVKDARCVQEQCGLELVADSHTRARCGGRAAVLPP